MEAVISRRSLAAEHARPIKSSLDAYIRRSIERVAGAQSTGIAQVCANLALEACSAGSAGVSLLDPANHESGFKWTALTGLVYDFAEGCSPRHDSACGTCIDSRQPLLFKNPAQRFTWMKELPVQVHELMVAPIYARSGAPVGTIWVVHHASLDHFDASDMHYLETIASQMRKII